VADLVLVHTVVRTIILVRVTKLLASWYYITTASYAGSGFDRGHNCPSVDCTRTVTDDSAMFLISNMMLQVLSNNQQTWTNLEGCRQHA
jgi:endonuclease G